ncbi:hypothetical protein [Amnibacterium kyonggiense]
MRDAATEERILARLAGGGATLAQLRASLPDDDLDRRALPSMGEEDPFGRILTALVNAGRVVDEEGVYRAADA